MLKAKKNLAQLIEEHFDEIVNHICNRLQKISPSHYEVIDFERHQEREEDFLNLIITTLKKNNNRAILDYITELANTRHNEGYSLHEVQQAINIIEEELWQSIIKSKWEKASIIQMLFECHRLLVLIRNQFAQAYLDKQIEFQKRMNELKERFYIYRHDRKDVTDKDV